MSLITRCPACATMFKVVPDQLRMSEGWVRCGRCAEVFDASLSLQPLQAPAAAPVAAGPAPAALPAADAPPAAEAPPVLPQAVSEPPSTKVAAPLAEAGAASPAARPAGADRSAGEASRPPLNLPPEATLDEEAVFAQEALIGAMAQAARREAWPEEAVAGGSSLLRRADRSGAQHEETEVLSPSAWGPEWAPTAVEPAPPSELSFVRAARRRAFWRGRAPRGLMRLLAAGLVLALALQWVLLQRDRLAAAAPALKPWLSALCMPLGCRIAPPRQIESVAIEGSSFSRLGADAFRLSLSLRNSAATEVAMPSLELTLTDLQDQPVLRRVLHPADLGAPPALAASGEWSASTALAVDEQAGAPRVAGYRLIAFYP